MVLAKLIKTKKRLTAELMRLVNKREKYFIINEEKDLPYDFGLLSSEISGKTEDINNIQLTINKTNIETKITFEGKEIVLYQAIVLFGTLKAELANIEKLIDKVPADEEESSRFYSTRRTKEDIQLKPIVGLDYLTKEQQKLEQKKDLLDELIQKVNWTTEIK